jgi:hypothetical protein
MELLKAHNWMPWKRRMLAVFRDLGLEKYITEDAKLPESADPGKPTTEEKEAQRKWKDGDAKTRCRIELAISDAEMVHIMGAETAREMWEQLTTVKESKGRLGVLATRRALYRAAAEEGFDMPEHIAKLRQLQEELHTMGNKVPDDDFVMILITSLPESWDNYTSAYLGSSSNKPTIKSQELVAILLEEYRRRKERTGDSAGGISLHAKGNSKGGKWSGKSENSGKECYNCHKTGHLAKDCWAKGGKREGQGPKGRKGPHKAGHTHQARDNINSTLNDVSYMSRQVETTHEFSKYDWLLDSATTSHICTMRDAFTEYYPLTNSTIQGIGTNPAIAKGRGTIIVNFSVNGSIIRHNLRDVLYVPNAPNCLLSLSRLDDSGGYVHFKHGKCALYDKKNVIIGTGSKIGGLFLLNARAQLLGQERTNYAASQKLSWDQWHRRFGHISITSLERLDREKMVNGMSIDYASIPSKSCEACIQAKQAHKPFPNEAENRSEIPGERVMSDVWGPAGVKSIGGFKYYISFMDDAKRYGSVLFLKDKTNAFDRIQEHGAKIERKFGRWPKWIRFDNGTELVNDKVKTWAASKGIEIEVTAPYSPSQHGVAERFNRTLLELARAMLIAKDLPPFLWDEAVAYANYLRNRAPTRALEGKTPYEAWNNHKPNVSHLREFGCDVWVLDETKNLSKLKPRSKKMIFVGFNEGSKSIRYYDPQHRNIKSSRNVAFNENEEPRELEYTTEIPGLQPEGELENSPALQTTPEPAIQPQAQAQEPSTVEEPIPKQETQLLRPRKQIDYKLFANPQARKPSNRFISTPSTPPDTTRSTQSSRAKSTQKERANIAIEQLFEALLEEGEMSFSAQELDLPRTPEEALAGPEAVQWKAAMDEEYNMLVKMGTWEKADLPPGRNAIGSKWVFKKKHDENGKVIRFKARLVVQGFAQKPGTDYSEDGTFAPVMRFETLRTLLAFAAVHNLKLRQFDIKGAYLHGYVNETIYMIQPPGYEDGTGRVCLLVRSLYGLKQAGNVWNHELNSALAEFHFTQLKTDYCCYIRRTDDEFIILLVWVDDLISISTSENLIDRTEGELKTKFDVKSLGKPSLLLGIKLH